MAIDILGIEPNKVSTDAKSYSLLMIGEPKIGKSTFMQELYGKRTLFIASEKRFGTMDGAFVAYVSNWTDYQMVLNQLNNPKAHEKYDAVVVDTLDNLGRYCDDYVAGIFDETVIGEKSTYGNDYNQAEVRWEKAMKKLENSGFQYGAVVHSKTVTEEVPFASLSKEERSMFNDSDVKDGVVTITKKVADLPNRYNKHIEKSFDNVVFGDHGINQKSENDRVLYLRGGLKNGAKVTIKNVPDAIPFSVKALNDTFKKALGEYSNTTEEKISHSDIKDADYDYEELMEKVVELATEYSNLGRVEEGKKITEDTLGVGVRVEDLTSNRVQELALLVVNLENGLKKLS